MSNNKFEVKEDDKEQDMELIMEVFEIRNEVEQSNSVDELIPIQIDLQTRFDDRVQELDQLFQS